MSAGGRGKAKQKGSGLENTERVLRPSQTSPCFSPCLVVNKALQQTGYRSAGWGKTLIKTPEREPTFYFTTLLMELSPLACQDPFA